MRYLLDTCVLSELTKPTPSKAVVEWLERCEEASLFISVLTLGELERGVRRLAAGSRRRALETWLEEIQNSYSSRIFDVTAAVAVEWGRLTARSESRGKPIPVVDALIGSTAIVHALTVVTRNTTDIGRTGARVVNPW